MDKIEKKQENVKNDTTEETKVFRVITKEDIEKERKKQAIKKENITKKVNQPKEKVTKKVNEQKENVIQKVNEQKENISEKVSVNKKVAEPKVKTEQKVKTDSKITDVKIQKNPEKPKYNNYQEKNNNKNLNDYKANLEKKKVSAVSVEKAKSDNIKTYNKPQSEIKNSTINQNVAHVEQPKIVENNEKNIENKQTKRLLVILLVICIIVLLGAIVSTLFGTITMNSKKIINGVKVNNIELSGLTKEDAYEKLEQSLNNSQNNTITVKRGDYSKTINLNEIEGHFNVEQSVTNALNVGREGNLIQNNYKTIGTFILKNKINSEFKYNEELLEKKINEINLELPGVALDVSYIINGDKLIIKNGTDGLQIQRNQFKQNIINSFSGLEKTIEIPVEHTERKEIDIEAIHKEIYKTPSDAYYTTNPRKISKEIYGLDFAVSMEEAKSIIKENKEEYVIPLKRTEPRIKLSDLDNGAFPDILSRFTTYYGTADVGRNANIALAAKSINSTVIMPGETFSFNDLIGECSARTGYKEATIYMNGELSTGIGGGICQASTTLYNSVLRSNLEIVERRNHSLGVTYVPAGQDAMVSIGTSDFKFKNNREYPVKVIAYVGNGSITCEIQGLKQDVEYEVKLESKTIEKTDEKYKVETYKVLYLNGKEVSRTWLSKDTYKYHQ